MHSRCHRGWTQGKREENAYQGVWEATGMLLKEWRCDWRWSDLSEMLAELRYEMDIQALDTSCGSVHTAQHHIIGTELAWKEAISVACLPISIAQQQTRWDGSSTCLANNYELALQIAL